MASTDAATVNELVHLLDRTERLLITFYYVDRLSLAEIALVLDIGQPRVTEMLRLIHRRIRTAVTCESNHDDVDRLRSSVNRGITSSPV